MVDHNPADPSERARSPATPSTACEASTGGEGTPRGKTPPFDAPERGSCSTDASPAGLRAALVAANLQIAALTTRLDDADDAVKMLGDEVTVLTRERDVLRAALVLAVAWLPSEYAVATAEGRAELQGIRAALTREGEDD